VYHLRVKATVVRLHVALVAASVAWAVLLVAVPFFASRDHASGPVSLAIVAVYAIGGFVCHQLPERSYRLWNAQMPVCARCAGIYFGAAIGALAATFRTAKAVRHHNPEVAQGFPPSLRFGEARRSARRGGGSPARVRFLLALAAAPTIATLVYEWTTGVMPPHPIRAASGAVIGLAVAWLLVAAADNQVN
jgi:hypothetical protein